MDIPVLELLQKYDIPTPRYTSYPTVPYWDFNTLDVDKWKKQVLQTYESEKGEICIYIHLPFCENLCTFCACNKRITVNHEVEDPYITSVLTEWKMYCTLLNSRPIVREIHLGGGTPTFFSPENLTRLLNGIINDVEVSEQYEFSIEVHPNYTTEEHIKALSKVGFNRISIGVQDFDPHVQFAINRIQSFEKTQEVVNWARKHFFQSINVDLVYGLPFQTIESIELTIDLIKGFLPDRIAFYSYAHVPWKSKVQRRYNESDLPSASLKWEMYQRGKELLEASGFKSIGMDHFALLGDKMFSAASEGRLHRNFMGYTTTQSKLIIGLGVSSISDAWTAFAQNDKEVESYQEKVNQGLFPLVHGHSLNSEDQLIRKKILSLMCQHKATLDDITFDDTFLDSALKKLKQLEIDGLILLTDKSIVVTEKGRSFIRNISAAIDAQLWRKQFTTNTFSKAI